jgi:hypothetical protein
MTAALGSEPFRFCNFQETLNFVRKVGDLAETEGHQPDISFGWAIRDHLAVTKRTTRNRFVNASKFIARTARPTVSEVGSSHGGRWRYGKTRRHSIKPQPRD